MTTSHNRSHPLKGIVNTNDDPTRCAACSACIVDRMKTVVSYCCGAMLCLQCWPPDSVAASPCQLCHSSGASRASIGRLKKHAKSGRPWAQLSLGSRYWTGVGITKSVAECRRWNEKAAKQNHPDAVYNIGNLYMSGQGCDVDLSKAREFFQRGIEADGGVSRLFRRKNVDGLVATAASYLQTNLEDRCERALSILLPLTGMDPNSSDASVEARFRVGYVRYEEGNFQSAYSWYCSVVTVASAALTEGGNQIFMDYATYNAMLCCKGDRLGTHAQLRFWARLAKKRSISGSLDLSDRRARIEEIVRVFRELRLLRDTCGGCGAAFEGKDRKFCRGCRTYCYCSRDCQKMHWNRKEGGHREDCKAATELKRKLKEAKMQPGVLC